MMVSSVIIKVKIKADFKSYSQVMILQPKSQANWRR